MRKFEPIIALTERHLQHKEPLREWILDTKQADFLATSDNFSEIKSFVKKIGTNPLVWNNSALFEFPYTYHIVIIVEYEYESNRWQHLISRSKLGPVFFDLEFKFLCPGKGIHEMGRRSDGH